MHGSSGCGKSAIIKALKQWTDDECDDIIKTNFGSAKYDQLVSNEPLAATVATSNELCENVLQNRLRIVQRFQDCFQSMGDGNVTILTNAIPALTELLQKGPAMNNNKTSTTKQTTRHGLSHTSLHSVQATLEELAVGHWAGESETDRTL